MMCGGGGGDEGSLGGLLGFGGALPPPAAPPLPPPPGVGVPPGLENPLDPRSAPRLRVKIADLGNGCWVVRMAVLGVRPGGVKRPPLPPITPPPPHNAPPPPFPAPPFH